MGNFRHYETTCGYQPFFGNFTIEQDDLASFRFLCAEKSLAKLDDASYEYFISSWTEIAPTFHLNNVHLAAQFDAQLDKSKVFAELAEADSKSQNFEMFLLHKPHYHLLSSVFM